RDFGQREGAAQRDGAPGDPQADHHEGVRRLARDSGGRPENSRPDGDADDECDRTPQPERARQAALGHLHWSASLPSNPDEAALSHSPSAISHVLFAICSPHWYDAAPCCPRGVRTLKTRWMRRSIASLAARSIARIPRIFT